VSWLNDGAELATMLTGVSAVTAAYVWTWGQYTADASAVPLGISATGMDGLTSAGSTLGASAWRRNQVNRPRGWSLTLLTTRDDLARTTLTTCARGS
jgi:hypothetical protein